MPATGPLTAVLGASKVGVVLGNGSQIDSLTRCFWKKIQDPKFITLGINRICCATTPLVNGFAPDLHLVIDAPPDLEGPYYKAVSTGLRSITDKTWRLTSHEYNTDRWPHDQRLDRDKQYLGPTSAYHMRHSSADAAINILYRIGVRDIVLYGVEFNGTTRCATVPKIDEQSPKTEHDGWYIPAIDAVKSQIANLPGLRVRCGCKTSRLVQDKVVEFGDVFEE